MPPPPKPVSIAPKMVWGLRTDVVGNIHFDHHQSVIYPVAGVLAFQDVVTMKQQFLRFVEGSHPTTISISPNRRWIAVAEKMADKTWTNIYEIASLKKKKTLILSGCPVNEPAAISFTHDSRMVAILSKEPDAFLSIFCIDRDESVFMGRASNSAMPGRARYISCNPGDTAITAVGGEFLLKLMNKTEKGFGQIGTVKGDNIQITSLCWLSQDVLVAGTNERELLFVEGGDPKAKYSAFDTELIDLTKVEEGEEMIVSQEELHPSEHQDVLCITNFQRGFIYALHNDVHVYEKETSFKFIKRSILTIPVLHFEAEKYRIVNMAVNAAEDTVIATTLHSQIYISALFKPETLKIVNMDFRTLGEPIHIDSIIALSCCAWKSIIMTASRDLTVRIWNYQTLKTELVKKYQLHISVMALHPSGVFVAIGFSDSLRFCQIQLDTLKVTKNFNYPNCSEVEFSHLGHLMAAAHGREIIVVSIFNFEILYSLKGHNGNILSLVWSFNDSKLVSSGSEGAVYEWDTLSGKRVNETVQKGIEYRCLALTSDNVSIIGITSNGMLREIVKSNVIREFNTPDLSPVNSVGLARSDMFMFLGTEGGQLYNVQCPLGDSGGGTFTNYRFFHKSVNKLLITYDDRLLVTASEDGTLVIWYILNIDGKTADHDPVLGTCNDITTSRINLLSKIETIKSLELRMEQQVQEFQYKIQHGDVFHSEQMRDIHSRYCTAIEDMKTKYDDMSSNYQTRLTDMELQYQKQEDVHQKEVMRMEADFHEKIIQEYEKVTALRRKMDDMKEEYETKLRKSAGSLQDTIVAMEESCKEQLQERQDFINQLMKDIDEQKKEFVDYCKQVEIDNDRNMVEMQLNYEKRLKEEAENSVKWRGEAGVLAKKIDTVSDRNNEMEKEIETLKQQRLKSKQNISELQTDAELLKREITDRDWTIKEKEKRLNEVQKKNLELEKYKQVLNHKINELKLQIEPLEDEIREKKDQIIEMEKELAGIQKSHKELSMQLSELRDKYTGTTAELRRERMKRRNASAQFLRVCGEIHELAQYIQKPDRLKQAIMELYQKYADDKEVKQMLEAEAQIQNEFIRQREQIEKLSAGTKETQANKKTTGGTSRLIKENIVLTTELNKLRAELKEIKKDNTNYQAFLGLSSKYMTTVQAREKLEKAIMSTEDIQQKFAQEIDSLKRAIKILQDENMELKQEMQEKEDK